MLILSYLCQGPPSGPYVSDFPPKTQYVPPLPPTHTHTHTHTLHGTHVILLDLITWTETDQETPHYVLHSPVTLSFSNSNIFLNTPFRNTLSLCSFQNVRDQVSHPHETRGKTTSLCILSFVFWIANWKTKFLDWIVASIPWVQSALNFFMNAILIVMVVAKSLNSPTLSKIYYLRLCCDFFPHSIHETWPHT